MSLSGGNLLGGEKMEIFGREFFGGIPFGEIRQRWSEVPNAAGVYAIIRRDPTAPNFLQTGTGGYFKGKDPNVSTAELANNWVQSSNIVYFGKAGATGTGATLLSRLKQYEAFGRGGKVGHHGGRYIWQLSDAAGLAVWWTVCEEEPATLETELIALHRREFGSLPFANIRP